MRLLVRAAPLLLLLAGCHRSAPEPAPSAALDRSGLTAVVGRRVRGDSSAIPGARPQSSWLVSPPADSGAAWSLHHLTWRGRDVILLQREAARDGALPVWVVTDAGYLPSLAQPWRLASSCGYGESSDPRLLAVARNANTPQLTDIRAAWVANLVTGRIDTATTTGLRCVNQGFGAD